MLVQQIEGAPRSSNIAIIIEQEGMKITVHSPGYLALREGLTWDAIPAFAVLTGPNGSGKSQLLRLIDDFYSWASFAKKQTPPVAVSNVELTHGDVAFSTSEFNLATNAAHSGSLHQKLQETINVLRGSANVDRNNEEGFYQQRRYDRLREELEASFGQKPQHMPEDQLRSALPFTFGLSMKYEPQSLSRELSLIFFSYHQRLRDRRLDHSETEEQAKAALGIPPWDTFDVLLHSFGLPFRCSRPTGSSINPYRLTLTDAARNASIGLENLSSGEKALVGLVVWMLTFGLGVLPKLILLDEPDAHLHASMIPRFVDTLHSTIVGRFGSRVIMTTHRAETMLRCPERSLFELQRDAQTVNMVEDRDATAAVLTSTAFVVLSGVRCVLVEDQDDADFFALVCQLLWAEKRLPATPRLVFQPVSVRTDEETKGGGRTVVKAWVNKLASSGLSQVVQGLVDHDNKPELSAGVHQIGRYSIENYLLDPIVVFVALSECGRAPVVSLENRVRPGLEGRIREFPQADKDRIVRAILEPVAKHLGTLLECDSVVQYADGPLSYPEWLLSSQGKRLCSAFRDSLGAAHAINHRRLRRAYEHVSMVPEDLVATMQQLTGET